MNNEVSYCDYCRRQYSYIGHVIDDLDEAVDSLCVHKRWRHILYILSCNITVTFNCYILLRVEPIVKYINLHVHQTRN